jgi:HK97 family phage major capsid protein
MAVKQGHWAPPREVSSSPQVSQPSGPDLREPGFVDLARLYLEGAGYRVEKKPSGRSFTGFLKAVQETANSSTRDAARRTLAKVYGSEYVTPSPTSVRKAPLGENAGTVGGYLVPMDYSLQMMKVIAENTFVWPRANIIPMNSAEMRVPKIDAETVGGTAGVSNLFGSVQFNWGSSQVPSEIAEPKFRQLELKAWDLLGTCVTSNQFLMDTGPAGEDALVEMFGRAVAWYAEYAFFQGTGTATQMPLGMRIAPCCISIPRGVPATVQDTDLSRMAAALLPQSWERCIWACAPSTLVQIFKIPHYIQNLSGHHDYANIGSIFGRPLFVSDKLLALGNDGDVMLIDPWLYVVGLRMQTLVDVSPHSHFASFQTDFRIWLRLDAKPLLSSSVTLADTTTVVSPFVKLT